MRVIYFSTQWCAPCKALKPIAEQVSKETGITIDYVDAQTQQAIAKTNNITSVPTIIGVDQFGKEVFRHIGMTTKQHLLSLFKKL